MFKVTEILLLIILASSFKIFQAGEVLVRYDGIQLWRLTNIQNSTLIDQFIEYGAVIYKQSLQSVDASISGEGIEKARKFLTSNNVRIKVLHSNIQERIEEEKWRGQLSDRSRNDSDWNSGITWENYHDLEVIYGFLKDINKKHPKITELYTIGKTSEGRELKVLRISENPKGYKKIWIDGGMHAREWISPASVTYILDQLMSNWQQQPKELKQLTWYFMPVSNPDGYVYTRTTDRLWRKNRAKTNSSKCIGVDLNRNFPTAWRFTAKYCTESYGGPAAGSELETKAIMNFLLEHKSNLVSFITFHNYDQYIMYPYAYTSSKVPNDAELEAIANKAAQSITKTTRRRYKAGKVTALINYGDLGGSTIDWSYSALGAKYSFAMELRDLGEYGFLLPADQIIPTGEEAFILVKTLAEALN